MNKLIEDYNHNRAHTGNTALEGHLYRLLKKHYL